MDQNLDPPSTVGDRLTIPFTRNGAQQPATATLQEAG